MSAAEIHRELCAAAYSKNVTSEGTARQWCRMFKNGRTIVYYEERSGRPSVVRDFLVQSERRLFTLSELSPEFPQTSRTVLYEIIIFRPVYHKFCRRWIPEMLTCAHKTQWIASALIFRAIFKKWLWIYQSNRTSNRWWNLGFICECWDRKAVNIVDAHTFTKKAENV
jgi:hypothetical protein